MCSIPQTQPSLLACADLCCHVSREKKRKRRTSVIGAQPCRHQDHTWAQHQGSELLPSECPVALSPCGHPAPPRQQRPYKGLLGGLRSAAGP